MIEIQKEACVGCGKCVKDCVAHNIILKDGKAEPKRECFLCGHCVAVCPKAAIVIPEYDMDEVEDYQKDSFVLKTGKPQRNIEWMRYPDGVARRFQVFKAPYYNKEGKIIGLVGISRDITDMSSLGETGSNP